MLQSLFTFRCEIIFLESIFNNKNNHFIEWSCPNAKKPFIHPVLYQFREICLTFKNYIFTIKLSYLKVNTFAQNVGAIAAINGGYLGGSTSYSAIVYPDEVQANNVASLTRDGKSYPVLRSFFGMFQKRDLSIDWIYHFGSQVEDIYYYDNPMSYTANDKKIETNTRKMVLIK